MSAGWPGRFGRHWCSRFGHLTVLPHRMPRINKLMRAARWHCPCGLWAGRFGSRFEWREGYLLERRGLSAEDRDLMDTEG